MNSNPDDNWSVGEPEAKSPAGGSDKLPVIRKFDRPEQVVADRKVRDSWFRVMTVLFTRNPQAWELLAVATIAKVTPVAVEIEGPDPAWMLDWVAAGKSRRAAARVLLEETGLTFDLLARPVACPQS